MVSCRIFPGVIAACFIMAAAAVQPCAATPFEDAAAAVEKHDYATAVRIFRTLAEQGDVASQYNVGMALANGLGVERDDRQAVEWLRKAADADYAIAELMLGVMLKYGRGSPPDQKASAVQFERAALHGNASAQFSLGLDYQDGIGVEKDQKRANALFRKAAMQGHANAQIALAAAFTDGAGGEKDLRQAYMWLTLAAKAMDQGRPRELTYGLREEIAKKLEKTDIEAAGVEAAAFVSKPDPDAVPEGKLALPVPDPKETPPEKHPGG